MTPAQGLAAGKNPSWTLSFWNRVHRYRCLLTKFWWVMVFVLSASVCLAAWIVATRPSTYLSNASLIVENKNLSVENSTGQNSAFNLALDDYMHQQIDILKGRNVQARATDHLLAQYPDVGKQIARDDISVDYTPRNSILVLNATGRNPLNTQRYLEALMEGYLDDRRARREDDTEKKLSKVRAEVARVADEVAKDEADIIAYERAKGVVFQNGQVTGQGTDLTDLRKYLSDLEAERDRLKFTSPEESLSKPIPRRTESAPASVNASSPQEQSALETSALAASYQNAQQLLAKDRAELADLSSIYREKHPTIVDINKDIRRQQDQIADLIKQNKVANANRLVVVGSLIERTEKQIDLAKGNTLNTDLLRAEFEPKQAKKERDTKNYSDLQGTLRSLILSNNVNQDEMSIFEPATPGMLIPSNWAKMLTVAVLAGLAAGVGILLLIDRMDDRMNSISDFQLHFSEHVIGQIPRDAEAGENTELLRPDDARHQLVESFRNLRSTLLFMPLDGIRPKTLLVTSAVPNEGKSTISSNLALVLASAGMKTLLIDADLRRGEIHKAFGLSRDPGLTDVLGHSVNWKLAIRDTGVENLHILPRGRNVLQPSEYLLNRSTDLLLKELYPLYDYIIIDSSPVLAADDTASLAPKIDATLFVVRLSFTSAKMTRKSLEILYNRQANIPGLILNQVDTSSPEFVYYQYSEYYHGAPTDEEPVKTSSGA